MSSTARVPAFVIAIALGNLLVPLNSTMIVVALPLIARDLGADPAASAWLITSYLIAMAAVQPIAGRLGDRFGRRRLMLGALAYFIVASIGGALAPSLLVLVLFRLQQALAAAAVVPNGLALLRGSAVAGRAGMFFGIAGAMTGIGAAVGPLLGGLLAAIDWRLIFLVNIPLAGTALLLGWRSIEDARPERPAARPDVIGAIGMGVLLSLAAWILTGAGRGVDGTTVLLGVVTLVAATAFIRYELRHPDPALPPRFFTVRAFAGANVTIAFANVALYGSLIGVPILLAGGAEASVRAGIALSALSAALIVGSPVSGLLADRLGARWPTALGGLLITVGLLVPVLSGRPDDYLVLLVGLPIAGAGVALTFPATRIAAMDAVPARHAALASGVTSSSRYFGGMVGSLVAVAALARPGGGGTLLFGILAAAGVATAAVGFVLPPAVVSPSDPVPAAGG
ncbi:MAG TPA: MFS transporter [Candidatus Limnocylindria bacterium]